MVRWRTEPHKVLLEGCLYGILISIAAMMIGQGVRGQTQIPSGQQVRPTVVVVEWAKCTASGSNPDGTQWNCNGLELYRFRMSDGTLRGPFISAQAPTGFAQGAIWTPQVIP